MGNKLKIVEAQEVQKKLKMYICIELMKTALRDLEQGNAIQPLRTISTFPNGEKFGFMPAYLGSNDYFGAKVLSGFPQNVGTKYPSHIGYVMLFESKHGCFVGMADATVITQVRTGAVSGIATQLLSREDSHVLALIGAGAQARSHLEAIKLVRDITEVRVYDVNSQAAEAFCDQMSAQYSISVKPEKSPEDAVNKADIICTLTPSKEPYLQPEWISPGTHINAVGAFTPSAREITSELMAKSKLYADEVSAMKKECGEFLVPLAEGVITESHIKGSLGQLLLNQIDGRVNEEEITLFDALGLAVEDVACAKYLCTQ